MSPRATTKRAIPMNRTLRVAATTAVFLGALCGWTHLAGAQVWQPYWTARPVPTESPAMGAAVGFGDDLFRIAGHTRFNMTSASDLGLELVFDNFEEVDGDDSQFFGFGADYKYLIVPQGDRLPFDFAAQGCFGMEFGDDVRLMSIPFGVLGSKTIPVGDEAREITPFAGMYLIIENVHVDTPAGDNSNTDVEAEIRFGSAFQVVGRSHAYAALHAGNGTMFFLGFTAGL